MPEISSIRNWLIFEGILFIILGLLAIAVPGVMTLSVELVIGVLFIISGLILGWRSFQAIGLKGFFLSWLSAAIYIVAGILLLAYPLSGVITLTLILTAFFLIDGAIQIYQALSYKDYPWPWGWRLFSGIVSILLACIILAGLPQTAIWAIGLLVGINMLFFGSAQLAIAWNLKNDDTHGTKPS